MNKKILVIPFSVFFLAFFFYIWKFIDPALIFHHQQLGFSSSAYFFQEFLQYPGGITEYLSLFLFQFASSSFAGSLLYTLLVLLLVLLTRNLIPGRFKKYRVILSLVPAVIIAGLIADYSFHLAFLVTLILILCFLNLVNLLHRNLLRFVVFLPVLLILLVIAFYFTGGFYFLIFVISAIFCLIAEGKKETWIPAVILLLFYFLVPWFASKTVFYITLKDAFLKIIPYYYTYKPGVLFYCLYFYIPLMLFITWLLTAVSAIRRNFSGPDEGGWFFPVIQYGIALVAGLLLCFLVFPNAQKFKIKVDYYSYKGQWDKVLSLVKIHSSEDRLIQFHTNRALYHTGKLPEQMFDYPQTMGVDGLFLTRFMMPEILIPTTQLYIDMGYINEAIHWGNEAISQNENSPQILEQLIIANIIAMNYRSAQLYINNLKNNPLFRKTANRYEGYLQGDNFAEFDSLVKEKRKIMPSNDFIVNRLSPQFDLISLLNDKDNRMAYEYLQAYFLLKNDIASFIQYFPMEEKYGYLHLPETYQEALALYTFELRRRGKDVLKLKLDSRIIKKLNDYLSVIQLYNGDLNKAQNDLKKNFGNTYWYYVHYVSPVTTKKQIIVK
jgi:hypothetical protein